MVFLLFICIIVKSVHNSQEKIFCFYVKWSEFQGSNNHKYGFCPCGSLAYLTVMLNVSHFILCCKIPENARYLIFLIHTHKNYGILLQTSWCIFIRAPRGQYCPHWEPGIYGWDTTQKYFPHSCPPLAFYWTLDILMVGQDGGRRERANISLSRVCFPPGWLWQQS